MTSKSKLSYYDVVRVQAADGLEATSIQRIGIVVGISEDQDSEFHYAVLDPQSETTTMYPENRLTPTGRKLSRQDLYDGTVLKVTVDSDTGRGSPVDPDTSS